jgi:hypothetical protein
MRIKHHDIVFDPQSPFANCKLDREKYAKILTSIVSTYADGFVLAINNEWGTGKTTFAKMWQQYMQNQDLKTLYFNAWENDFDINPIAAIMAELKKLLPSGNQILYNSLLKKGAVLAHNILPAVLKGVTKRYLDVDEVIGAIEGASKGATEILKNEIENYAKKQKGFKEFRNELEKFVSETIEKRPLIFIIDELDRCRPDFAVEVLEKMKHFFSVPGIVFVLCIDKTQLENAIKGFYGSEHLNATEYLRRFIDIEYTIPQPSTKAFCNYLYDYFLFDEFFQDPTRKNNPEWHMDKESFIDFSAMLFEAKRLSLREQEKIFAHARLSLKSFQYNNYVFPSVYVFLVYLKCYYADIYLKIKNRELGLQQFINEVENILPDAILKRNPRYLGHISAMLLFLYYHFYRDIDYDCKLIEVNEKDNSKQILVNSKYDPNNKNSLLANYIDSFSRVIYSLKISFLTDKIDLMENFKS